MAFDPLSLETLKRRILGHVRAQFPDKDLGPESYLGKKARAMALGLLQYQGAGSDILADAIPSRNTSTTALDEWAVLLGLSNGEGGYGRKAATAAAGGTGTVTGEKGSTVPDAEELTAEDGSTVFAVSGLTTIPGSPPGPGTVDATIYAVTPGSAGNLAAGATLTFSSAPADIDSTVTLTSPLTGGLDQESDRDLLDRIFARLQQPPKGGIASDYKAWAEAANSLVKRAYPYPLRGGLGTTHVVVMGYGSGAARASSIASIVDDVEDYINGANGEEGTRPITTQGFDAFAPTMGSGQALVIRIRLVPWSSKYNFDWTDTATSYSVQTWTDTAGAAATLELNTLAPATLKAAIDAGLQPRLQVLSTQSNALPNNPQVRATSYSDSGGRTTLTLENPLPVGFMPPNATDSVFAGGPMVETIAQAVVDYVDSLGPSRSSGYAAQFDSWEDACRIARLIQIALSATDSDGTRFASNTTTTTSTTIGVGGGAAAATDATPPDSSLTAGPAALYVATVAITQ